MTLMGLFQFRIFCDLYAFQLLAPDRLLCCPEMKRHLFGIKWHLFGQLSPTSSHGHCHLWGEEGGHARPGPVPPGSS